MSLSPTVHDRRRIYLMRHGHVDYFRDIPKVGHARLVPLTDQGVEQAQAAGEALARIPIDRAICSGLPRTRQTAEHVLEEQKKADNHLTLLDDDRLEEIHGSGGGEFPASRKEAAALLQGAFDNASADGASMGEGGETFVSAQTRAATAIETLLRQPDWTQALVVAHEGINRLLLSWLIGAELKAVSAFEQDLACINVLDLDLVHTDAHSDGPIDHARLRAVNVTPYNYIKAGMHQTTLEHIFGVHD